MELQCERDDLQGIEGKRHRRRHTVAFFRGGWTCHYCGEETVCAVCNPDTDRAANIDHITPKAKGGRYNLDNQVISCIPCNEAKEDGYWPDPVKRAKLAQRLNTTYAFFNGKSHLNGRKLTKEERQPVML